MADTNVVEQLYSSSTESNDVISDIISNYKKSSFENNKVLPYNKFKELISKSYRNYQYDIKFDSGKLSAYNDVVSVCCKSIGKLNVEIDDNTVKYFGRNRINGGYLKYKSPITLTFYDVIVDGRGTLLSYLFKEWVEQWNYFGDGINENNRIGNEVYTRRNYIDDVVKPCTIKVYSGGLTAEDIKNPNANLGDIVTNNEELRYRFFRGFFENDREKLTDNSAYASMFSGIKTQHGLVNTMFFALLMGSRIVDVAIGATESNKWIDNNNKVSEAIHELGVGGISNIAQTIENSTNGTSYTVDNVVNSKHYNDEFNKTIFFNESELDKIKSSENLNVSLKHEIQNAYKYSDTFKEAIKDLRTVIDGLGRLPNTDSTSKMYDGLSISLTDIPKNNSEMYDGLLDKLSVNNDVVSAVYDGLNSALNRSVSEIMDAFQFENESQVQEVRTKLNNILDELIGQKPLNLNSIKEDLIGVSKYINANRDKEFVKNLIETARQIAHSDFYNNDKMETITQSLYGKENDRSEVDKEFKGDFDTQKEVGKKETVKDDIDLEFDNSMSDTLFKQSDMKKENSKAVIKKKFGNNKGNEDILNLLQSRTKAIANEDIIQWGDDIVEAVKSELIDDSDAEKIRTILMSSLAEIMVDKFSNGDTITSIEYDKINEWYKNQDRNHDLGMPYTKGRNPFLMSRDIMQDITLPFQILMFALEEKRKYQTLYYDRMFIGGGWNSYLNSNTGNGIVDKAKNLASDLGFDLNDPNSLGNKMDSHKEFQNANKGFDFKYYGTTKNQLKNNGNYFNSFGNLNKPIRTINITECYPSSVELIDTLSNESTGEKSLPTFSVTLQFYNIKVN